MRAGPESEGTHRVAAINRVQAALGCALGEVFSGFPSTADPDCWGGCLFPAVWNANALICANRIAASEQISED
jgi:hypothetical protein